MEDDQVIYIEAFTDVDINEVIVEKVENCGVFFFDIDCYEVDL